MARKPLPGPEDLGALPRIEGSRPIGSFDGTALARGQTAAARSDEAAARVTGRSNELAIRQEAEGARAEAAALTSFGGNVVQLGQGAAALELDKQRYQYAQANSQFVSGKIDLDDKYEKDQDYPTLKDRYEKDLAKLRKTSSGMIESPRMRDRFVTDTEPNFAQGLHTANQRARRLEGEENVAYVERQGDKFIDQATKTTDQQQRQQIVDAHSMLVGGLKERGFVTATQADGMMQTWARRYALTDGLTRSESDPQGVINELRAAPGSDGQMTERILHVEGMGKNPRSSAQGVGQFTDDTWLNIVKQKRPDLAEGRSDADILALRADRTLGREMTTANLADNRNYLARKGVETTPGNLYLAHFLGPAGAAAVLQAAPNVPVADVLAKAVGPDRARAMVEANPEVLGGQLAGSVVAWTNGKMGGVGPDGGGIYNILRPDQRETLLAHAEGQKQKQVVNDLTTFKQRIDDTQTEAAASGSATNPVTRGEFIAHLGAVEGPKAHAAYEANLQLSRDVQGLSGLDPNEQQALIDSYAPKPGEGYAAQQKRQDLLLKAVQQVNAAKQKDPGLFAIERLPAVKDAWGAFAAASGDSTVSAEDKQQLARSFADKTLAEQQRVGVPVESRSILPKSYVDGLKIRLTQPATAGGPLNVVQQIEAEAKLWGDHWPTVYRQVAKEVEPAVRVIGSGVTPIAARLLTELQNVKLADILKDEDTERHGQIRKDVLTAFKPLYATMLGNEGATALFNDFRTQGEKLTAYYVTRGKTSSDAAEQAFKELVGFKYDFGPTYRIPKDDKVGDPNLIRVGASDATQRLDDFDLAPARDTFGGLTGDYLKRETMRAYQRDGAWVTAPDESGLMLVYKDEAVRTNAGKPLVLPWAQLVELGRKSVGVGTAMVPSP